MIQFIRKSIVFGLSVVNHMLESKKSAVPESSDAPEAGSDQSVEKRRENTRKIWENSQRKNSAADLNRKETSMLASQGKSDHSGSGYHGPGNVDHEKVDSNMAQRNFINHDSNRLG